MWRFKRWLKREINRRFFCLDQAKILVALEAVGVKPGMAVCVHSALSRLGHIDGGPDTLINALMEAVGPDGALLMPSFSTAGSMVDWLDEGNVFDVRNTPSRVGLLTEVFRRREGVTRSLHPTSSLAGWGARAETFLLGHENSETPYGPETPYGLLAADDDGYILMMETYIHSLLHHIQERVEFPNMYLPDERSATIIDWEGNTRTVRTRAMRPRIPYFVAIPSLRAAEPDWAILHDFTLVFPRARRREIRKMDYRFDGYPVLYQRRDQLVKKGVLKVARLGRGEIGLLHVKSYLEYIEPEFRDLLKRFQPCYDVDRIAAMNLPYS